MAESHRTTAIHIKIWVSEQEGEKTFPAQLSLNTFHSSSSSFDFSIVSQPFRLLSIMSLRARDWLQSGSVNKRIGQIITVL